MESEARPFEIENSHRLEGVVGGAVLHPIIAVGSSAGGLAALEDFLSCIPSETDASIVVIQHLSPDYRSYLDQLLQRHTLLEVKSIEDGMQVMPRTVYILPPNKEAILCQGKLLLTDRSQERTVIYPIDDFLRSLANEVGHRAIAVIFSGTGSDGSRGIREIHAAGGFVVAQAPESASFSGMPKNAIATGVVDLVLSPREAAKAIVRKLDRSPADLPDVPRTTLDGYSLVDPATEEVLRALRVKLGIEYTDYLPSVVFEAIRRRFEQLGLHSPLEYAQSVLSNQAESQQLLAEIVHGERGRFFCEDSVYERLSLDVIPTLMSATTEDQDFRAWVIGSGTGEEVYALAILLAEWHEQKGLPHRVKIFASDVHAESLSIASKAVYTANALKGLRSHHIEKYFIERPDGFHVVPELRKMVVFTPHNCLHEAPFTRMDIVSCRHLMQRLSPAAQSKVMSLVHFALRDGGVLLLGKEMRLGEMSQEFETLDCEHGIFLKHRLATAKRSGGILRVGREQIATRTLSDNRATQRDLMELYDRMLELHVPPAWLVAEDGTLLHTFQDAGKYLETRGRTRADLLSMVQEELRGPLMLLLRHVAETRTPIDINNVFVGDQGDGEVLTLRGEPLITRSGRNGVVIKLIKKVSLANELSVKGASLDFHTNHSPNVTDLERELELTRENLQLTIQDLRIANDELKETNEEVTCANEELQSANEELHSVNEELHTVNAEHQRKIDELTALNDDMDNLLTNSNVHTLFLSRDLRLRLFTPRIVDLFNLIPQDIGRHIATFNHNLIDVSLAAEAETVLRADKALRREVKSYEGNWFVLRISPYLSRGNVEGVVITLVDITSQKNAQDALLRSEQRFELAVQGSSEGIWDWPNVIEEKIWCSSRLHSILGHTSDDFELTHSVWIDLIHPEDRNQFERLLESGGPFNFECRIEHADRSYRWVRICGASHRDAAGRPVRMAGSLEDVTERRNAQDEVKLAVQLRDRFLAMLSHELRNPLAAVLSAIELHDESEQQKERSMSVIRRQCRQMARLLDDLLDVSRISNNKFELHEQQVDFNEIVSAAISALRPLATERELELSYTSPLEPILSAGDPQRLEQVIVNLLNNAIKYSIPGGQIVVTLATLADKVLIRVSDSGVGLSEEMKEKVFDLFVQSEATLDRANGGMGVGLTLVKAIVEMHGGTVSVESEGLNRGCEFMVHLPYVPSDASRTQEPKRSISTTARVVIVEDMADSREMLAELLSLKGHQPFVAADGEEGLSLIKQVMPDVALVDIGLPKLNGFEIARALRSDPQFDGIKLVALTGYGQTTDRLDVKSAGFDEHIVKPLKPDELFRLMNS